VQHHASRLRVPDVQCALGAPACRDDLRRVPDDRMNVPAFQDGPGARLSDRAGTMMSIRPVPTNSM
jgi:hypothetical protein